METDDERRKRLCKLHPFPGFPAIAWDLNLPKWDAKMQTLDEYIESQCNFVRGLITGYYMNTVCESTAIHVGQQIVSDKCSLEKMVKELP